MGSWILNWSVGFGRNPNALCWNRLLDSDTDVRLFIIQQYSSVELMLSNKKSFTHFNDWPTGICVIVAYW